MPKPSIFGLIYGMSPFGLTRTTDLTLAEAENFVKEYFKEFPGVKAWLDKTRVEAAQTGRRGNTAGT